MLTFDAAQAMLDAVACPEPEYEIIRLEEALGRHLVQRIPAFIDSPPFDKATMDGIAVGLDDDAREFRSLGTVAAGDAPERVVGRGECVRIMTGAMLPPGTGRVIRKEALVWSGETATLKGLEPDVNVLPRGANHRAGDLICGPRRLAPVDLAVIASAGFSDVAVAVPPRIAILATGDELVAPGLSLSPGKIYSSNGHHLAALACAAGFPAGPAIQVADDRAALETAISAAAESRGIVLLSGGVSVGDFDLVPACLSALGAKIKFHGVAVKPGKPLLFAELGEAFVFGLPGNPLAVHVAFEFFVRPLLCRLAGSEYRPREFTVPLAASYARRDADRTEFVPVRATEGGVAPVACRGSGHLQALAEADGLMRIDAGVTNLAAGSLVTLRVL